ncbi:MAG: hypothetical protein E7286_01590 [Lachnospiraceae bacterium]|nr:hypothetical protein [Lachnospiraceae bacterium]
MITPQELFDKCKQKIKSEWKLAFAAAFVIGLLVHMPIMLSDIPNHDGLGSMYFDQNMITSGRWFLTVACGVSSYFTLPWLIGLLAFVYLGAAAAALTELLEIKSRVMIVLLSGLLAVFPAIASTFAYVFTMDGYMMALLLAVMSVLLTKKYKKGFLAGAICLAFSMGIYQAYLPFAVILCLYMILIILIEGENIKEKLSTVLRYLGMGVLGAGLYYVILQILLKLQGKELSGYQGIGGMNSAGTDAETMGMISRLTGMLVNIYRDFVAFTFKGNVFFNNIFSAVVLILLVLACSAVLLRMILQRKWWKNPGFFVIIVLLAAAVPVAANVILVVSPEVTYHLLMRYQWVLFLILPAAFAGRYADCPTCSLRARFRGMTEWLLVCAVAVMLFNYVVTDHIAYSNLEKRYEKTYAYCVRLLDRIEQTPGYYQGIPIAIVGVVGEEQFPETDITGPVTAGMIGISGDSLLYTSANYEAFLKNYLGATLNFLDVDTVGEIYYSEEYEEMDSFPGENSVKLVDGVIYVKTENKTR